MYCTSIVVSRSFDPDQEERLLKLPTGVMAFTSEADVCNTQKMVKQTA